MTTRAALHHIDTTLRAIAANPAAHGSPEAALFQALTLLECRAILLGAPLGTTYETLKAEHKIPSAHHASNRYGLDEIGTFIGELHERERDRVPDAEDRIFTLRVLFRDEPAAAEITPEMAAAYLTARGWRPSAMTPNWAHYANTTHEIGVPQSPRFVDYGRRMCEALNLLAEIEGRSPLAVWHDMMEQKA